jgi:hypothetical protein
MRFELTTLTLARLCSTPELRPRPLGESDLQTIPLRRKRENFRFSDFLHAAGPSARVTSNLPFARTMTKAAKLKVRQCQPDLPQPQSRPPVIPSISQRWTRCARSENWKA